MSSSLYWRPPAPDGTDLGFDLKHALRDYYGGYIGEWVDLGSIDVGFLKGLIAGAGKDSELGKDTQTLIDAIGKYGHVQVRESS